MNFLKHWNSSNGTGIAEKSVSNSKENFWEHDRGRVQPSLSEDDMKNLFRKQ